MALGEQGPGRWSSWALGYSGSGRSVGHISFSFKFVGVLRSVRFLNTENSELIAEAMSIALGCGRGQAQEAPALQEVTCKEE